MFPRMASYSIRKRTKSDGSPRYLCLIRVKEKGEVTHSESRTFSKMATAKQWGKDRCDEIEKGNINAAGGNLTLRHYIQLHTKDPHVTLGRTKREVLKMVSDCKIADRSVNKLTTKDIIDHCKMRRAAGASPSTVNHDVSYIRSILKLLKPIWNVNVDDSCVIDAYHTLHELNLIGKSNRRSRRPTDEELKKLREKLKEREAKRGSIIPYIDILDFSILSCMRIGEVCAILWEDVDEEQKAVVVRDRKDPRKKEGNHMVVPLLGGAWEILQRQPKTKDRVFPYNSRSVTAGFQRVRSPLGIKDLRYHDLRREGASRLFERGYTIDEVAQVTGHRNINTLWQIYTELFPNRLHDKSFN